MNDGPNRRRHRLRDLIEQEIFNGSSASSLTDTEEIDDDDDDDDNDEEIGADDFGEFSDDMDDVQVIMNSWDQSDSD